MPDVYPKTILCAEIIISIQNISKLSCRSGEISPKENKLSEEDDNITYNQPICIYMESIQTHLNIYV